MADLQLVIVIPGNIFRVVKPKNPPPPSLSVVYVFKNGDIIELQSKQLGARCLWLVLFTSEYISIGHIPYCQVGHRGDKLKVQMSHNTPEVRHNWHCTSLHASFLLKTSRGFSVGLF